MSFTRRNYPRMPLNLPVRVMIDGTWLDDAVCKNISMGGMCISVEDSIVKNQQIGKVELHLYHDDEEIVFSGEFVIKWIKLSKNNTTEFGLQFTYYDSLNSTNLARIVLNQLDTVQT